MIENLSLSRFIQTKWRRYNMGREYRHMAELNKDFCLKLEPGKRAIYWQKKFVTELVSLELRPSLDQSSVAFILGSGPSLQGADIKAISEHTTFGVNGSILKFIEQGIAPDYYVISDANFVRERWDIVLRMFSFRPRCFFTLPVINEICMIDPTQLLPLSISLYDNHFKRYGESIPSYSDIVSLASHDPELVTKNGRIGFSLNPQKGLFTAHTVVYHTLQIAYGLGFRNIGILGMDLSEAPEQTRFYETGRDALPSYISRDFEDRILPSFEVVKSLCDQGVLSVYNLSLGSRLPEQLVPKLSLQQMLANMTVAHTDNHSGLYM